MNNRVGTFTLEELFNQNLTIPNFQRPYSWREEQIEQLLLDLSEANKENKQYLIGILFFMRMVLS